MTEQLSRIESKVDQLLKKVHRPAYDDPFLNANLDRVCERIDQELEGKYNKYSIYCILDDGDNVTASVRIKEELSINEGAILSDHLYEVVDKEVNFEYGKSLLFVNVRITSNGN